MKCVRLFMRCFCSNFTNHNTYNPEALNFDMNSTRIRLKSATERDDKLILAENIAKTVEYPHERALNSDVFIILTSILKIWYREVNIFWRTAIWTSKMYPFIFQNLQNDLKKNWMKHIKHSKCCQSLCDQLLFEVYGIHE